MSRTTKRYTRQPTSSSFQNQFRSSSRHAHTRILTCQPANSTSVLRKFSFNSSSRRPLYNNSTNNSTRLPTKSSRQPSPTPANSSTCDQLPQSAPDDDLPRADDVWGSQLRMRELVNCVSVRIDQLVRQVGAQPVNQSDDGTESDVFRDVRQDLAELRAQWLSRVSSTTTLAQTSVGLTPVSTLCHATHMPQETNPNVSLAATEDYRGRDNQQFDLQPLSTLFARNQDDVQLAYEYYRGQCDKSFVLKPVNAATRKQSSGDHFKHKLYNYRGRTDREFVLQPNATPSSGTSDAIDLIRAIEQADAEEAVVSGLSTRALSPLYSCDGDHHMTRDVTYGLLDATSGVEHLYYASHSHRDLIDTLDRSTGPGRVDSDGISWFTDL